MRAHVVFHSIAIAGLGHFLLAADCTGSGLTQDCEPGTLGCACGDFPECPKDEHNRVILCCPDPTLECGPGNICRSIGSTGGPDTTDDGASDSATDTAGTTSATSTATPTATTGS